jgi:molybdopterin synthase catalytic subunit
LSVLDVRLLHEQFDPHDEVDRFARAIADSGALATFIGKVRGSGGTDALELSHYAPLTLPGMQALAATAQARFDVQGLLVLHRVGQMLPGEPIVCIAAAATHRRGALEAVDFAMDHLKSDSWFWKRELRGGVWHWIEPREQDRSDLARWG